MVGLQLAALALRDRFDTSGFIAAFTQQPLRGGLPGRRGAARQPEGLRTFLLQPPSSTGCAARLDAVTSMDDGQEALEYSSTRTCS